MIENIRQIIKEILAENDMPHDMEINADSKFSDLGLTSFDLATLTVKIEDEFDVDIFEDGLISTVGEILSILEA